MPKWNGADVKGRWEGNRVPEKAADVARAKRAAPNEQTPDETARLLVQPDTRGRISLTRVTGDVREISITEVTEEGVITLTPGVVRDEWDDNALKVDLALLEQIERAFAADDGDLAHALGMARSKLADDAADVEHHLDASIDDVDGSESDSGEAASIADDGDLRNGTFE